MRTIWRSSIAAVRTSRTGRRATVCDALALLLVVLLLSPVSGSAQTSMGAVNGTVTDTTGGVLPGATATLVNSETGIETVRVSNESGYFTFINVRPGRCSLTVELQGLKTARISDFTVGVNENVARNLTLEVGQISEVVEVRIQFELL